MRRVTQNGKRNASPVATPNHLLTLHLVGKQEVFVRFFKVLELNCVLFLVAAETTYRRHTG